MFKFALLVFLLSALILVQSSPAKNTKKCAAECPTDEDIICAKGDGLEFAFLNECVLAKSNCENNRDMKKVSKGLCPGKKGVRLS